MSVLRRILGVLVMIAGILGLLLSLAGLALVWIAKPNVTAAANTTIATLTDSVGTSKAVLQPPTEALGATVDSLDALSATPPPPVAGGGGVALGANCRTFERSEILPHVAESGLAAPGSPALRSRPCRAGGHRRRRESANGTIASASTAGAGSGTCARTNENSGAPVMLRQAVSPFRIMNEPSLLLPTAHAQGTPSLAESLTIEIA